MELDIELNDPLDLFKKAEREKERLLKAGQSFDKVVFMDHLFNFAVTIHHLADWVVHTNSDPIPKEKVLNLIASENALQACKDICNSVKHLKIDRYKPTTNKAQTFQEGFAGTLSPGMTIFLGNRKISNDSDKSEEYEYDEINLMITMSDGEIFGLQEFCERAISVWREFLKKYGYTT
jgi:hypothetical protein